MYGGRFHRRGFTLPQANRYFDRCYDNESLKICDVVMQETIIDRGLRDAKRNLHLSSPDMFYLQEWPYLRFDSLKKSCWIPDNVSRIRDVVGMYESIWADALQRNKIERWAEIKTKTTGEIVRPEDGPPKAHDLLILSTLANLRDLLNRPVQLVTYDNDFLLFSKEIKTEFDIDVLHPRDLGSPSFATT